MTEAAARLERLAATLREIQVSDRTAAIVEMQALLMSQTLHTSPADAADFAEVVARVMRGERGTGETFDASPRPELARR